MRSPSFSSENPYLSHLPKKNPCSSKGLTTSSRLEQLLIDPLRLGFPNKSSSLPPPWFPVSPTKIPSLCFIRFPFICVSPNKNLFGSLMKKLAQFALAHRFPFFLTEIRIFMHCGSLLHSFFTFLPFLFVRFISRINCGVQLLEYLQCSLQAWLGIVEL